MKVIDLINNSDKTLFSFELLPPLRGHNINSIYRTIDPLLEFNPRFINVTYHQEEVVYKKRENGLLEKKTIRKRPGTVAISAAIKYKYPSVEVVPHIICGGFTKEETEYALIDFHYLGIDNILALRGDAPKNQRTFTPEPTGHAYANELVKQITDMNKRIETRRQQYVRKFTALETALSRLQFTQQQLTATLGSLTTTSLFASKT